MINEIRQLKDILEKFSAFMSFQRSSPNHIYLGKYDTSTLEIDYKVNNLDDYICAVAGMRLSENKYKIQITSFPTENEADNYCNSFRPFITAKVYHYWYDKENDLSLHSDKEFDKDYILNIFGLSQHKLINHD
jgi:hypothetical protein